MQRVLLIYDNNGRIWNQMYDMNEVPNGLPYLELEIPAGKFPISVDLTREEPSIIYGEHPKLETTVL